MQAITRRILAGLATGLAVAVLAPAASASINPSVKLNQSGTAAASTASLLVDIKFAPQGTDSPRNLTLSLPPGLLADASIGRPRGACLSAKTHVPACQVGTGSATALVTGVPVTIQIALYLVAPPKRGDLAGLVVAVTTTGAQLGSAGEIRVRPSGDPAGVGLNVVFTNLPNKFMGVPISLAELQSTFSAIRLPASCPATPANVTVTADSYLDPTAHSANVPLQVTGCSGLPFTPAFKITAARDTANSGVQVTTDITQPATPVQATSRTVALALPGSVLSPNVAAAVKVLCPDPSKGKCKTIGSAISTSPLYPTPLTGKAYLTGSLGAPAIALVFPPPFALTLEGKVTLATNTTTFDSVPDIPLTDLQVTLAGGPDSVFLATCAPASGTATSTLTSQNGDRTVVVSAPFTVSGCPPATGGGGGTPPPSGGGTTQPPPAGSHTGNGKPGLPHITAVALSGLRRGLPVLRLRLIGGTNAPKLASFRIALPHGLRFVERRRHKRLRITGVSVRGALIKSIVLRRGRLVVVLRQPVSSLSLKIRGSALAESTALTNLAKRHSVKKLRLKLTVVIKDAAGASTTVHVRIKHAHK